MSDPYVIWTMRRTGGTTLASLLSTLSEHPSIQHEPFNAERVLGHVSDAFRQSSDEEQLRAALQYCLAKRPVIKHCYELMSPRFNAILMEVSTGLGYRHIVLDRRNEPDRILSLELAQLTGAWGGDAAKKIYPAIEAGEVSLEPIDAKRALHQMRLSYTRRQELAAMIANTALAPFVVYFEDVYTDPQAGRDLIERLLAFLGIEPQTHAGYEKLITDALSRRGQNSGRILQAVPNANLVKTELEQLQATQPPVFARS